MDSNLEFQSGSLGESLAFKGEQRVIFYHRYRKNRNGTIPYGFVILNSLLRDKEVCRFVDHLRFDNGLFDSIWGDSMTRAPTQTNPFSSILCGWYSSKRERRFLLGFSIQIHAKHPRCTIGASYNNVTLHTHNL
ncbi:hypothetical protein ACTXT7_015416 [Hymenolepis weldensis]